jgi:hypothetical protein
MAYTTFIHGMANKPPYLPLKKLWAGSLARTDPPRGSNPVGGNPGVDLDMLGVGYDMTYYADVFYAQPDSAETAGHEAAGRQRIEGRSPEKATRPRPVDRGWRKEIGTGAGKDLVDRLESVYAPRFDGFVAVDPKTKRRRKPTERALREELRLPDFIQQPLMEELLRDVHHYFYNVSHRPRPEGPTFQVRNELQHRFVAAVKAGAAKGGPHVVVAHSMGTIVAYDCLRNVAECPAVDVLVTLGSPLGLDAVQDNLKPKAGKRVDFPAKVRRAWINVYDPVDPVVGFDPKFANDYKRNGQKVVIDVKEPNWGKWRHDIVKYLSGPKLRAQMRAALRGN